MNKPEYNKYIFRELNLPISDSFTFAHPESVSEDNRIRVYKKVINNFMDITDGTRLYLLDKLLYIIRKAYYGNIYSKFEGNFTFTSKYKFYNIMYREVIVTVPKSDIVELIINHNGGHTDLINSIDRLVKKHNSGKDAYYFDLLRLVRILGTLFTIK